MTLRAACYARYSTENQSELSTTDQLRICKEHAVKNGYVVLPEHCYTDDAVSGQSAVNRSGLQALLRAARRKPKPFDIIFTENLARSSRDIADTLVTRRELDFLEIPTFWIQEGFKSTDENADMLLMMSAVKNAATLKDISKQTHRGLASQILRGFSAGGRTFGYRCVRTAGPDAKRLDVRLEVNPDEAAVVTFIFELADQGNSYDGIIRKLTAEGIQPPRPRAGRITGWHPHAIYTILRNPRYIGQVIWNREKFIKSPDGRRVARPRPEHEWMRVEQPELRIIDDDLWQRVQQQLQWKRERYGRSGGGRYSHLCGEGRGAEHLLTGFLRCGVCGGPLTIVAGYGAGRNPRYGCRSHAQRHSCTNDLRESEASHSGAAVRTAASDGAHPRDGRVLHRRICQGTESSAS
jgi:DNA invertase Pin-like site-specific DNA recombinase